METFKLAAGPNEGHDAASLLLRLALRGLIQLLLQEFVFGLQEFIVGLQRITLLFFSLKFCTRTVLVETEGNRREGGEPERRKI